MEVLGSFTLQQIYSPLPTVSDDGFSQRRPQRTIHHPGTNRIVVQPSKGRYVYDL